MLRRLPLAHTLNTRDLGGYPITPKGQTRYGRFLRSDLPVLLSDEEAARLLQAGITTIIDLRSFEELDRQPSFFAGRPGFDYHHFPLGMGRPPMDETDIGSSYLGMLDDPAVIRGIMTLFARADTGFLYHCTAGKDRTGMISALLLSLVNVSMPDILADYQVTHTYIAPMLDQLHKSDPSLPAWIGQSRPEYLLGFFDLFFKIHPSVEAYLLQLGLISGEISAIKAKLVSP